MKTTKFKLIQFLKAPVIVSILSIITLVQAKAVTLPTICTKGGSAIILIRSIDAGDGYHANLKYGKQDISAYCAVGDCEVLYDYKITNVKAKVTLSSIYMEEDERTLTCSIIDMELNPYVETSGNMLMEVVSDE